MSLIRPKMSEEHFIDFLISKGLGPFIQPRLFLINDLVINNYHKHARGKIRKFGLQCVSCPRKAMYLLIDAKVLSTKYIISGDFVPMTIDHIIPKSRGGSNHDSNKQRMCAPCNSAKNNKCPWEINLCRSNHGKKNT